jgi:hypothetical protein
MTEWSLNRVLEALHDDIERRLHNARMALAHPGTKGDASERVWLELLQTYLPKRYQVEKGHIVDSRGAFSQQIDVVIFDRQYSPFILHFEGQLVIPAESVYAVFEAKQTLNAGLVLYAQQKAASVRALHRTSLPIPHAGGTYDPKPLAPIMAGILTLDSDWNPPLGEPLIKSLHQSPELGHLDLGCVAAHGTFVTDTSSASSVREQSKAATAFLLELIARLQSIATVPMIDTRAYAAWLD